MDYIERINPNTNLVESVKPTKTYKQARQMYNDEIHRLAEVAFRRYSANKTPLYLAGFKTKDGLWNCLDVLTEEQMKLQSGLWLPISPEPIPYNATAFQLEESVLRPILNKEPLVIFADCS